MTDSREPAVQPAHAYRTYLVERLSVLTESAHTQLAVKLLKQHNLVPEGTNPADIAKGIQKRHGIPAALVPQVVHYAATRLKDQDGSEKARMAVAAAKRGDAEFDKSPIARIWKGRLTARADHLRAYAAYAKNPDAAKDLTAESTAELPNHMEAAADTARNWHAIATHPKKGLIVTHAFLDALHGVSARGDAAAAASEEHLLAIHPKPATDDEVSQISASRFGYDGGYSEQVHDRELHAGLHDMHARAAAYNPNKQETWAPHYGHGAAPIQHFYEEPGTDPRSRYIAHNRLDLFHAAVDHLNGRRGITPTIPHSAEHIADGNHFRAYTLDTPEKANAGCWGQHFCISTGASADSMNRHYHDGTYKPVHLITKVVSGDGGKPVEKIHAAYLPELLPGQQHEDPEQAVRNSGNNGAVTGKDFEKIHPLLSKLDARIDAVKSHYLVSRDRTEDA